ncbi:MAG: CRISPR-associated endonuclease Cas3'' [Myxococcota bacterium]|nr:CRISPR-associated endonuclease Cas3'' [Myxococcota bacterium]
MRVLVEQTHAIIRDALGRLDRLWDGEQDHRGKVGVHLLMGGAAADAADTTWNLYPEERAVFIGTQDMLLSRALNRGYAAPPARWPLELGHVSHDVLWVMDEVQLMDVGLATSAQLQAFHDDDGAKGFRPRRTWWMSATLQPDWLRTVDTAARHASWVDDPIAIDPARRTAGLGAIKKSISTSTSPAKEAHLFARVIADRHAELPADGEHGKITLVVCNTVARACETFDALGKLSTGAELELVHSRFRPAERAAWRTRFLDRDACKPGVDRIIVATQVVEAGVDISAGCLVTELAPWPSLVQRFGRCARYGGTGIVVVVDRGRDDKSAPPYQADQLDAAWAALAETSDVGIASLDAFEEGLAPEARAALYPYVPAQLLLRRELDELFDTTPDLTGAQLDVSRFIRSGDDRDVQVFWLDIDAGTTKAPGLPARRYRPRRDELCNVPFLQARNWLCGEETKSQRKPKLRPSMRAWIWDWIDGAWSVATRPAIVPGRIICVAAACGGYDVARGFDPGSGDVPVVPPMGLPGDVESQQQADDAEDNEDLSFSAWKTLACHVGEAADVARSIASALGLDARMAEILVLAARWHDLGKAHPVFQGTIRNGRPDRQDLAKAPSAAWLRPPGTYRTADDRETRAGFRHELASALALFSVLERYQPDHSALLGPWIEALDLTGRATRSTAPVPPPTPTEQAVLACTADEFDLLAYLVICHHGKVRVAMHASPKDQDYRTTDSDRGLPIRGVLEGDVLPGVVLETGAAPLPQLALTLEPATLGLSTRTGRSWRERTLDLQARFGPGGLAWLEALIIAADRRASRLKTADPALAADKDLR